MTGIYERRVQFADTDAAGVVHFSRILCYAEEAEHDLLTKLGIPLLENGGWPRVHVSCDYLSPTRMGETIMVDITPVKIGRCSIEWTFSMAASDKTVASGGMKTVYVDSQGQPAEINDEWRELLVPLI